MGADPQAPRPTWDADEFGQTWAGIYDEAFAHLAEDTIAAVEFLASNLPPGARLLELGVGTGRLAVPLAEAGMAVTGLDTSQRMLDQLAAKSDRVTPVLGDMVAPPVDGPFDCVLIAFNSLYALPDQQSQIDCLRAVRALLTDGGVLVLDLAVPRPGLMEGNQALTGDVREEHVALEIGDHDPLAQTVRTTRVLITDAAGIHTLPLKMRYTHVPELDLMAQVAGLTLTSRAAGWDGAAFDRDSVRHISCYAPTPLPHHPPTREEPTDEADD